MKLLLEDVVDVSFVNSHGNNCLVEAILNGHRWNDYDEIEFD